jgi:predicted transport protein
MADIKLDFLLNATGNLQDKSACERFRNSIENEEVIGLENLEDFIEACLTTTGPQYNFALQDIVNAIGKRLGFSVEYGVYQGKPGVIGYDGFWQSLTGKHLVVDTKTTGAYTIDPSQITGYMDQLAAKQEDLDPKNIFGLFVVGRFDSGPLENSIRGAGLQNKIRVVGCSELVRLLQLKQSNNLSHDQIVGLMLPFENINIGQLLQVIERIISIQTEGPSTIPEETPTSSSEYTIDEKFSGKYAKMRPVYDALEKQVKVLGPDVSCYAKKYYIAFKRNNIFGVVNNYITRIDLGLCLDEATTDDRLFDASNWGWSRINKGMKITDIDDIDDQLMEWLEQAYEKS